MPFASFDPMVGKELVKGQYFDYDAFLENVDMVVLMVGHSHIRGNERSLEGKRVFDTRNVLKSVPAFRL